MCLHFGWLPNTIWLCLYFFLSPFFSSALLVAQQSLTHPPTTLHQSQGLFLSSPSKNPAAQSPPAQLLVLRTTHSSSGADAARPGTNSRSCWPSFPQLPRNKPFLLASQTPHQTTASQAVFLLSCCLSWRNEGTQVELKRTGLSWKHPRSTVSLSFIMSVNIWISLNHHMGGSGNALRWTRRVTQIKPETAVVQYPHTDCGRFHLYLSGDAQSSMETRLYTTRDGKLRTLKGKVKIGL